MWMQLFNPANFEFFPASYALFIVDSYSTVFNGQKRFARKLRRRHNFVDRFSVLSCDAIQRLSVTIF